MTKPKTSNTLPQINPYVSSSIELPLHMIRDILPLQLII
jgi:hypothetical protein